MINVHKMEDELMEFALMFMLIAILGGISSLVVDWFFVKLTGYSPLSGEKENKHE